jgi:hypothetical protein
VLWGGYIWGSRWGRSLYAAVRSVSYLCVSTRFAWGSQASRALSDGWASALAAVYRDYDVKLGALRLRLAGFIMVGLLTPVLITEHHKGQESTLCCAFGFITASLMDTTHEVLTWSTA